MFTAAAAATGATVIAVDVSPPMAGHLRDRFGDADNVTVVEAGFLTYAHAGPPADFVHCRNALHQLPDFWKGIALAAHRDDAAARRHPAGARPRVRLRPARGRRVHPGLDGGRRRRSRRGWTPDELAEHVRLEFSTYRWLFEPMLERAGFEILEVDYVRRAYGAYTCRR